VRLQHNRCPAIYLYLLQPARTKTSLFGFCKTCLGLGFATGLTTTTHTIGMRYGRCYESIQEHQGCGDNQEGTFHGYFLLVFEKQTVILSCPQYGAQVTPGHSFVRTS
jgi:hypothetical protein